MGQTLALRVNPTRSLIHSPVGKRGTFLKIRVKEKDIFKRLKRNNTKNTTPKP